MKYKCWYVSDLERPILYRYYSYGVLDLIMTVKAKALVPGDILGSWTDKQITLRVIKTEEIK